MITRATSIAEGHIIVVQEQRFCLMTDEGQGLYLTLTDDVGLNPSGLRRLCDARARVSVQYEAEPDSESGVARSVRVL
jgi:hypothetical protein